MSRNSISRFGVNPAVNIQRSRFNRDSEVKLTFRAAELIPFYVDEVLPGDTFKIKTSKVVRMSTPFTPFMDNLFLDTYYFYVPNRLLWKHWVDFMGENTESPWIEDVEYSIPKVSSGSSGFPIGSAADYLGVPTGVANLSVNALPFRACAKIYNDWFRDENLCEFEPMHDDDANRTYGTGEADDGTILELGGTLPLAAKYHDYFTSALPAPQKGPSVAIPISADGNGLLPVTTVKGGARDAMQSAEYYNGVQTGYPMLFSSYVGENPSSSGDLMYALKRNPETGALEIDTSVDMVARLDKDDNLLSAPLNLAAQAGAQFASTINELRLAFQIQKFYERAARGGSRYIEMLKAHFGVTSPDSRLQRSEYLGGNRVPIMVNQVISTNGTLGDTRNVPGNLGMTGAMSLTTDRHFDFTRSFTEHGYVIGFMCVRYHHTYQQGLERLWNRSTMFDFYFPELANIGEQAILNKEIFAQGSDVVNASTGVAYDDEAFGFQEAWADYRYKPSRVSALMRSSATGSLDIWHLADDYSSLPHLSQEWIQEDYQNVNRVLSVSDVGDNFQFFADVLISNQTTRPMPMYSIPGLLDHH